MEIIPLEVVCRNIAAGQLATRLGNRLGKRGKAEVTLVDRTRTHLWKPLLHEIAAGSMDLGVHEIDFLAQSHWHGFRYQVGEMTGLVLSPSGVAA